MYQHPEDYDLYSIGSFDDDTGELTAKAPERLCVGSQVRR